MLDRLPDYIDPVVYAEKRRELMGEIKISDLLRISDLVADKSGCVLIDLAFEKVGRLATVQGKITGSLQLECQSCLQSLAWEVDSKIRLGVVSSLEAADRLAAEFEPLWVESDSVSLKEIVEDEIILAIPDFPRHDFDCLKKPEQLEKSQELETDERELKNNNPFSVLAKLKDTGD